MKIEDFVSVLEKCTLQWARAVVQALKESKGLHLGNSNMSLDFLFVLRQGLSTQSWLS